MPNSPEPKNASLLSRRAGIGALINPKTRARRRARGLKRLIGVRRVALGLAALPLFQATGCFPDPLGALNFELQRLLSGTLVNAFNILVRNFLDL